MLPTILAKLAAAYRLLKTAGNSLQSPFLLLIRLYWGWQFAQTGWGKLHNIDHVIQFFTSLNIPAPAANAWFVSLCEFLGGMLLIAGLGSRLTALVLAGDMFVAYVAADSEALRSIISDPGKFYTADPYTFLFACLIILIFGPGRFAIDALLERKFGVSQLPGKAVPSAA
jgi:putative oxidoreductase